MLDEADRTWEFFKNCGKKLTNIHEETETTATSLGYGANTQPTKQGCDDATFDETVSNFGTAFAANSSAFSQLTKANQTMGTDISQNITALQKQINDMSMLMHNMSVQHAAAVNTANAAVPPVPPYVAQQQQYYPQLPPQQQYQPLFQQQPPQQHFQQQNQQRPH